MATLADRHPLCSGRLLQRHQLHRLRSLATRAPAFFARDDETAAAYVHRQPVTPEEIALAEEALTCCPTETIGNDG